MTLDGTTPIRRVDRIVFARVGDEFLALDGEARECFSINATSMTIWELLEAPTTPFALCADLGQRFAVSQEQCRTEVMALLTEWLEAGLIEVPGAPGA